VIGCGYVGLVTGSCLADIGHEVIATDNDATRIETLASGGMPIHEPGLDELVAKSKKAGRLSFTANCGEAVRHSEAIFICVGTPPLESGDADLSSIDVVAQEIAAAANSSKLVIEKSTVPAQTGEQLRRVLGVYGRKRGVRFRIASNPEFLREGTAIRDFFHPDRIVVGVEDEISERQLRELYEPILSGRFQCPVHGSRCAPDATPAFLVTTISSAELIKHASNSFLGMKISYANMIADLCEEIGASAEEVLRAVGMDPRIGSQFLNAGIGFGGFCLPKDIQAFVRLSERHGVDFGLLKEVERINKERIDRFVAKIREALWVIKGKRIGALGLTFKPNTDDIRFAPAIEILKRLQNESAVLLASDPFALERARAVLPGVRFVSDPYAAAKNADALLVLTEWRDYKELDWARIYKDMARPLVIDGRNMLSATEMARLGFEYVSVGRPKAAASTISAFTNTAAD
jgi:UDPglucose 6-dehydrogenase